MKRLLLFAGTSEGRRIAEYCVELGIEAVVCVATERGKNLLPQGEHLQVRVGRLDQPAMVALLQEMNPDLVADATHPYAEEASRNIAAACKEAEIDYRRILRKASDTDGCLTLPSAEAAAAYLQEHPGNVLLTVGSKMLPAFAALPDSKNRCTVRILPDGVKAAEQLGFESAKIIGAQGPFSEAENEAHLQQAEAAFLVTKESGIAGGFAEKIAAAKKMGVVPLVISRPVTEVGISPEAFYQELEDWTMREVALVGIGPGNPDLLTIEARRAIEEAELLIGAERMLAPFAPGKKTFASCKNEEIVDAICRSTAHKVAVLFSGDIGFYSGAARLEPHLLAYRVKRYSGISSMEYFCNKIGMPWQEAHCMSFHGRSANLTDAVRRHRLVFALTGGNTAELCQRLVRSGFGGLKVWIGENLSYEMEAIHEGTAKAYAGLEFAPLSVMLIENPHALDATPHGIADTAFERGNVPMTKSEVRSVSIAKLGLHRDSVCWDVGAGTGSVTVEMALAAKQVYAVEKHPSAVKLLLQNTARFGLENVKIVPGAAPKVLETLPAPDAVFVGGTGGHLKEVLSIALWKNPNARIVINAVTLDTLTEAMNLSKTMPMTDLEVVQMQVSRNREVAGYQMMQAQNPVYILSFRGNVNG